MGKLLKNGCVLFGIIHACLVFLLFCGFFLTELQEIVEIFVIYFMSCLGFFGFGPWGDDEARNY